MGVSGAVAQQAQEDAVDPSLPTYNQDVPANPGVPSGSTQPPVAIPMQTPVFATDQPPGVVPPPPPPSGGANQPATPAKPEGASVSSMQSRSRVIEDLRPERVQVYPDDPDSAWWEINPRYAFARAQREQRPLLLLFTGMWNTQAMALSEEVFSTQSFNEYVKENLVICYLNYPRNYTDAPDSLRHVKDKFKVRGYPNVLVFNPNGEVEKGIRGYHTGRPVDYFNELKGHCRPVLESVALQKSELVRRGFRDWSNYLGKAIFARFVKHDTKYVVLQDARAVEWTIAINDLAPEDQKMVESFQRVDKVKIEQEGSE